MTNILMDISGKIEASHIKAISEIKNILETLDIPFLIVGASARDYILEHYYNIKSPRMTMDIDIGIKLSSWEQFEKLEHALIETDIFEKDREKQRFIYKNIFIDVFPFGDISNDDNTTSWPPNHETIMNVSGFCEAFNFSTRIRLDKNPVLEVKIPTIPGLAVLKLVSWKDKYPERKKDAQDFKFIMNSYEHTGIEDRLYERELAILEEENFDLKMASIRLLGNDMDQICDQNTFYFIKHILAAETRDESRFHLVTQMMETNDSFEDILILLKKLFDGIMDRH